MLEATVRFLGRADMLAAGAGDFALAMTDVVDVLRLMRSGEAAMVSEAALPLGSGDPRAMAYALPATIGGRFGAVGLKWAVHHHTQGDRAPGITSLTLLNDLKTGLPFAIVESGLLTATRTAAVSALALRHLAGAPLHRVAVLGAGAQAKAHLLMLVRLFPELDRISVWNRTLARAEAMIADVAREPHPELVLADSVADAIDGADAVITTTAAPEPIIGPEAVRPGRLILQVGYHEVSFDAIDAADVVTLDLWGDFCRTSAKSLFQMYRAGRFDEGRVAADLARIVLDGWRPPRAASVIFSNFGLNVFDIALAARVAESAKRQGLGSMLAPGEEASGDSYGHHRHSTGPD